MDFAISNNFQHNQNNLTYVNWCLLPVWLEFAVLTPTYGSSYGAKLRAEPQFILTSWYQHHLRHLVVLFTIAQSYIKLGG